MTFANDGFLANILLTNLVTQGVTRWYNKTGDTPCQIQDKAIRHIKTLGVTTYGGLQNPYSPVRIRSSPPIY